jgi:hypothetical protein
LKVNLGHTDEELLEKITYCNPAIGAADVLFSFLKGAPSREQRKR